MSAFLTHMLDRHRGRGELVQPRDHTRFETDAGDRTAESSFHAGDASESSIDNVASEGDAPGAERVASRLVIAEDNMLRSKAQQQAGQAVGDPATFSATHNERSADGKLSGEHSEQTSASGGSLAAELNEQLSTVLARLTAKRGADPPAATGVTQLARTQPVKADAADGNRTVQPALATPALNVSEQPARPSPAEIQRAGTPSNDKQSAPLEPPSWLLALQTEFKQRWRDIKAESTTEPVVNVTIGRVEVRAIQEDKTNHVKPEKKAGGVMSLDDYLKQRERGGPA